MASQFLFRLLQYVLLASLCVSFAFDARANRASLALRMGRGSQDPPLIRVTTEEEEPVKQICGDPLREATGIRPSIHPLAINAIAEALKIRAQNKPDMPLRLNENIGEFEITLAAGRIAQEVIQKRQETSQDDGMALTVEEQQTTAGRIIGVIKRIEDLEWELYNRCKGREWISKYNEWGTFGLLADESSEKKIDEKILDDPLLRVHRAECLLALFLELLEGPGLRSNNVTVPCMDVDFLDSDRFDALFGGSEEQENAGKEEEPEKPSLSEPTSIRPSLHPIAINAIAEALKIRAQNKTSAPLRLFDDSIEWFEVQLSAGEIVQQTVTSRQKTTSGQEGMELTDDEAKTVGGRIMAVIMRLEDLEWELNHRCKGEAWIAKHNKWDDFGLLEDESCVKTLDKRILSDHLFAVNRAERLLALHLLNLEGPGLRANGASVPGGSDVDFLDEDHYKLMMPKEVAEPS